MTNPFDHTKYSAIVFIDSMLALECKPLDTVPWQDIDSSGSILVLVVPQVNTEINKKKRDGRLAKRARAFNRLIAPAAGSGVPEQIVHGPPDVSICVARCSPIDWDSLDNLDPQEGDHKVVAQILHAKGVPLEKKMLLSQDTNPLALATNHNLKCRKLPEGWLLDPEPHPKEKDVVRLKQRVRVLEANEPVMELSLTYGVKEPLPIYQVAVLKADKQEALLNKILRNNSKKQQQHGGLSLTVGLNYDRDYDGNYKKFVEETIPNYVISVHKAVEEHFSQFAFKLKITNTGQIQAEDLIVSLTSTCGAIHNKFMLNDVFPPFAPSPNPYRLSAPHFHPTNFHQPTRDRHEMAFISEPSGNKKIQFQCADFRHGRIWEFDGIGTADVRRHIKWDIRAV